MRIRKLAAVAALCAVALAAAGCAYKIEILQGSERVRENIEELRVGMTQEEVRRLLGPPAAPRLFKENRWIYAYQERESGFVGRTRLISVEVLFDDNGLVDEVRDLHDDFYVDEEGWLDG